MSSLPEEMYHEILLRLPVKSLLICKSVCRNWYALISNSDFVKLHLYFTTQKNNPIFMSEGASSSNKALYSIGYDSLTSSVCAIETDYPFKSLHYLVRLVGSCNGLVCIRLVDGDEKFFNLWNPATREYKEIPESPIKINEIRMSVLGYDHNTDDYKLVIGTVEPPHSKDTLVQVYSLASNSWKPAQTVPLEFHMQKHGVLVNGYFHWLVTPQRKYFLLSFDISDETFKEMQLSKELLKKGKDLYMILGVLEGFLCVLFTSHDNGIRTHCEVWEMLDYGVEESWTRRYIITHEHITNSFIAFVRLLWSFRDGKILFKSFGYLVLYDPEHGSARKLSNKPSGIASFTVNYIESLVSLESGTFVGGEARMDELRET